MNATPIVAATLDVRRLPGLRRQLGLTQPELCDRIGARVDDLSRLERAVAPGGLLDRVVDGLTAAAEVAAAQ